jgi:hypothetical protein
LASQTTTFGAFSLRILTLWRHGSWLECDVSVKSRSENAATQKSPFAGNFVFFAEDFTVL